MAKYNREQVMGNERDTFKYRAFITMLSQNRFAKTDEPEQWKELHKKQEFEISVVIEGVEIDYLKFIDRYSSVYDMCSEDFEHKVEERAKEIVREKYSRTMRAIEEVFEASNEDSLEWIRKDYKEGE